jgi:hypothetical protein
VDDSKEQIVRQKLDTLFDYVADKVAAEKFKKELDTYNLESTIFNETLQSHNEKYYSKPKRDLIAEKTEEINKLLAQHDTIINDYKQNMDNIELLRDAVRLQIREITPEIENLRRLKNELNEVIVEINTVGNIYDITSTLVQRKVTLVNTDVSIEEPPSVMKYSKKAQ